MGTDIHIRVERRASASEPWKTVKPGNQPCYYCDAEGNYPTTGNECYSCKGKGTLKRWPSDRSYITFAALADVRNGFGFAGVYRHEPIKPISPPKGPPEDMASEQEPKGYDGNNYEKYEAMGLADLGDHSFSWLTLQEIVEWDGWSQVVVPDGKTLRDLIPASYTRLFFEELPKYGEPQNVRMIFGFDS